MEVTSKTYAAQAGLIHYFTGKPCKYGHIALRYVAQGKCSECERMRMKAYFRTPVGKQRALERYHRRKKSAAEQIRAVNRRAHLKRAYGITQGQFDSLLATQSGCCAICQTDKPAGKGQWNVDHCHSRGHVRGLLCHHCNLLLGGARDSVQTLTSAIKYLIVRKHLDAISPVAGEA